MPGQVIGYARVSSVDQNLDRQLAQFEEAGIEKLFQDKVSGSTSKRPGLDACKDYMREGDTLVVCSIDRLARNMFDLQKLIYEFQEQGITVRFLKENLTFGGNASPMDKLLLGILGSFAEFERALIRERQQEGMAAARAKGKPIGRPKALNQKQIEEIRERMGKGQPPSMITREMGVSKSTLWRLQKELGITKSVIWT